jgi:hypothetical protein
VKTTGIIAVEAEIKPVGKIPQWKKFQGIGWLQEKLIKLSPIRLAQETIGVGEINFVISKCVVKQGGQIQANDKNQKQKQNTLEFLFVI